MIDYKSETRSFVDIFFDMTHAYNFIEDLKEQYPIDEWEIIEERINLIGGGYRAGIVFSRRQLELEI